MRVMLACAAMAMIAGSPAAARDRTGYQQIVAGDLAGAEATLTAERRIFPQRPELMLNLASVYAHTGRAAEAAALYRAALAAPEVAMEMPDGATASSYALARAGSARLNDNQVRMATR